VQVGTLALGASWLVLAQAGPSPSAVVRQFTTSPNPSVCGLLTPQAAEQAYKLVRKHGETDAEACRRIIRGTSFIHFRVVSSTSSGPTATVIVSYTVARNTLAPKFVGCHETDRATLTKEHGAWRISHLSVVSITGAAHCR
jgi:hypothetical protein